MSEIKVHPSYIMASISVIEKYERALASGRQEISLLKNQLDHKIVNRKDIGSRLTHAAKSYSIIEEELERLQEFVEFAMRKYQTAENEISRKSHELDYLVNYSTDRPIRAINPGENPLRTGKDKLRNILNDLAPLIIMLNPFLLFPITYRNHMYRSSSLHFDRIKETHFFHQVLEKHKLSNKEKIAVQSYAQQQYEINPIAVKASKKKNSSKKEEAESFIGKGIDFLFDFFLGDIATMVAPDSTFGERVIATGFTFFKPVKLGGMFLDSLKIADSAKDISKAKNSSDKIGKNDNGDNNKGKKIDEDKGNDSNPQKNGEISFKQGYDKHLVEVVDIVRKGNKGVVGGHNLDNFEKAFKDRGWDLDSCIISKKVHPSLPGVYEVKYKIPAVDREGNIIPSKYKSIPNPKTVYDPKVISDEQMLAWGKEAMKKGVIKNREITGYASNGLKFKGYIENGEITNFYPTLK